MMITPYASTPTAGSKSGPAISSESDAGSIIGRVNNDGDASSASNTMVVCERRAATGSDVGALEQGCRPCRNTWPTQYTLQSTASSGKGVGLTSFAIGVFSVTIRLMTIVSLRGNIWASQPSTPRAKRRLIFPPRRRSALRSGLGSLWFIWHDEVRRVPVVTEDDKFWLLTRMAARVRAMLLY